MKTLNGNQKQTIGFDILLSMFVTAMTFATGSAQAQVAGSNPASVQMSHKIEELQIQADNLENSVRVVVEQKQLTFPDLKEAYAKYLNEAETQIGNYKAVLGEIRNSAQTELQKIETEYNSVKQNADRDPSRINLELLSLEETRKAKNLKALETSINVKYQSAIVKMISLDGRLTFPTTRRLNVATVVFATAMVVTIGGGIIYAQGWAAANSAVAAGTATEFGVSDSACMAFMVGFWSGLGGAVEAVTHRLGLARIKNNFGVLVSTKGGYKKFFNESVDRIYKECDTSGCVLQMSQEYQTWMDKTRDLNLDVDLGAGVNLKALHMFSDEKVEKKFWQITQTAARKKETVAVLK